ncbi:MAG: flagellar motor switch protein FliG [Erysipelotrichaceae bacterium]
MAKLTSTQRAAALLVSLGPEHAAKIYRHLDDNDIEKLSLEISKLQRVRPDEVNEVIEDFYRLCVTQKVITEGGVVQAKGILEKAFGPQLASSYMDRVSRSLRVKSFDFVRKVDYKNLLAVLQNEHPQTIAVVLSYAVANQSSAILSELPKEKRVEVIARIAKLDRANPDALKILEKTLESKLSTMVSVESQEIGGINFVADIMNGVERGVEKHVFDELNHIDPELVQEIRKQMFVFEDIVLLDDIAVQQFIRDVDSRDLAVALKATNNEVSSVIFRNMSGRMQETIQSDMELMSNVRMRDVEEAQQRIVNVIRKLEEEGTLVISKGGKDEFVA